MKSTKKYLLCISTILFTINLFCQNQRNALKLSTNLKDSFNSIYGLDPLLFNGKIYKYFPQGNLKGKQYLNDEAYTQGDITIRGKKYENLMLNYDICNQELILRYSDSDGFINSIIISKAWLQDFTIGLSKFKLLAINNFPERIYQIIGNGPIKVYYYFKKDLELGTVSGISSYEFVSKRTSYLLINNVLNQYQNNKSFVKLFIIQKKALIKKYMRTNRMRVRKASDHDMEQLMNYCNDL